MNDEDKRELFRLLREIRTLLKELKVVIAMK